MLFLVQILKKTDGTFAKGTTEFSDEKQAYIQMYVAMSSAMSKEDTAQICCLILDESGATRKREFWAAPIVEAEPVEALEE